MSGKIFINYRRKLSEADALHLSTILTRRFGRNRIFIDTHGIDGFSDWLNVLKQQVAGTAAMIAVIGPGWLDVTDDQGNRRLDNPQDFVRFEIAEALSRDIPVLPVLLDGAEMPKREQLPEDMGGMRRRQAMHLQARRFEEDAADIARALRRILKRRRVVPLWAAAGLAMAALGGGIHAGPDILRQADRVIPGFNFAPTSGPERLREEVERLETILAQAKQKKDQLERERSEAIAARDQARSEAQEAVDRWQDRMSALESRVAALNQDLEARESEIAALRTAADMADGMTATQTERAEAVKVQLATGETKRIVPGSGESFKDCAECPEMVLVPAGRFLMGSPDGKTPVQMLDGSRGGRPQAEKGRDDDEGPQHEVRIPQTFAVGKFEVTFAEWGACVAGGGCTHKPSPEWMRGRNHRQPVMRVSWDDIKTQYLPWLNLNVSGRVDRPYRLPSEAEWEYAARAESSSRYANGNSISTLEAQFSERSWGSAGKTVEVGSFAPNSWGLYDVHGNVWEWVEDCWNEGYADKPDSLKASGASWTAGDCDRRVLRGGAWFTFPEDLRSANRYWNEQQNRLLLYGFRLARTLAPAATSSSAWPGP